MQYTYGNFVKFQYFTIANLSLLFPYFSKFDYTHFLFLIINFLIEFQKSKELAQNMNYFNPNSNCMLDRVIRG